MNMEDDNGAQTNKMLSQENNDQGVYPTTSSVPLSPKVSELILGYWLDIDKNGTLNVGFTFY